MGVYLLGVIAALVVLGIYVSVVIDIEEEEMIEASFAVLLLSLLWPVTLGVLISCWIMMAVKKVKGDKNG